MDMDVSEHPANWMPVIHADMTKICIFWFWRRRKIMQLRVEIFVGNLFEEER
jgi:hypothetical protein